MSAQMHWNIFEIMRDLDECRSWVSFTNKLDSINFQLEQDRKAGQHLHRSPGRGTAVKSE